MADIFSLMRDAQVSDKRTNRAYTTNGAVVYKTTGNELLDLNFATTQLRGLNVTEIEKRMRLAYYENPVLFCKWMFYLRDCREGLGEKHTFKEMFKVLIKYNEDYAVRLVGLIPVYGYWKDMFDLLHCGSARVEDTVKNILIKQFKDDLDIVCNQDDDKKKGKSISLLGKWMPSINAGKAAHKEASYLCRNVFHITFETYRKAQARLRAYLKVVECDMCAREFGNIDYSIVPSIASLKYRNAFKKHDGERYKSFIESVNKGETKVNASVLFPHDIYAKYSNSYGRFVHIYDASVEAFWKNLPNTVTDDTSTIVVCDGSGSMMRPVVNSTVKVLDVARALGIYFSERLTGPYKDKIIEFSETPKLIDLSNCDSLFSKRCVLERYIDASCTNIESVFDLILRVAVENRLTQEELPKNVLIISDGQFDLSEMGYNDHLFDIIASKYNANGYILPRLVFWNVYNEGKKNTIPAVRNDNGVCLVSGYSANIAKMVCNGETDPFKALYKTLNSERYKPIEEALAEK